MLYFTFGDPTGPVEAIYNGRMAFVLGIDELEARKFLRNELAESQLQRTLHHELCHQNLFLITESGNLLSGFRVVARFRWSTRFDAEAVKKYYRARTLFYLQMRDLHEFLVEKYESATTDTHFRPGVHEFNEIESADLRVLRKWDREGIQFSTTTEWLLRRIGKLMSKSFCVVCGRLEGQVWKEFWVSENGVVNDAQTRRPGQSIALSILKPVLVLLQIEKWFKNNIESDWAWMIFKFQEEHRLTVVPGLWSADEFDRYLIVALRFAANWSHFGSHELFFEIVNSVRTSVVRGADAGIRQHWLNQPSFTKLVNFFYLHGN